MNKPRTRREFLTDVGRGMLIATVGCEVATGLGLGLGFRGGSDGCTFVRRDGTSGLSNAGDSG